MIYCLIGVILAAYFGDEIKSPATLNYDLFNMFNSKGKVEIYIAISFIYIYKYIIIIFNYFSIFCEVFYHYFPSSCFNIKLSS